MNETLEVPNDRTNMQYDELGRRTEYFDVNGWMGRSIRLIWNERDQLTQVETNPRAVPIPIGQIFPSIQQKLSFPKVF
jgi:hypothetical protein